VRRLGLAVLYRKPAICHRNPAHVVFSYWLWGLTSKRPDQVWTIDTTYIPRRRGFLYLVGVMDRASRRVLTFRLATTLAYFCWNAVEEVLDCFSVPEIFNADQGGPYTSYRFIELLEEHSVQITVVGPWLLARQRGVRRAVV
jgi:putative transposase